MKKRVYAILEEREGITGKRCSKCEEWKPLNEFGKHKNMLGGVRSDCKTCRKNWCENNKLRINSETREKYANNPETGREASRKYRRENKDKIALYNREYHSKNREKISKIHADYYKKNQERKVAYSREWYIKNKVRLQAYLSNEKVRKRMAENGRKWEKENPEKVKLKTHRRRARKAKLPNNFTETEMINTLNQFGGCALTGDNSNIHWDHVIPLATSRGGTTYGNMIPLRSDLNCSKNDNNIFEWFEANKQRFKLNQERFDSLIEFLATANAMTKQDYKEYVYECHNQKDLLMNIKKVGHQ